MKGLFFDEFTALGDFELTTPIMRVSDPSYARDVWCSGTIGPCKTGTWEAAVMFSDEGIWGSRVAVLAVRHEQTGPDFAEIRDRCIYNYQDTMHDGWSHASFEVGVDSGQAGFFDEKFYQDDSLFSSQPVRDRDRGSIWYDHVGEITLSRMRAGVIPHGAVSSSGFGDGGYDCFTHQNAEGTLDFAFIVFIGEDEDE